VQEAFAHIHQQLASVDALRADTLSGWALTLARRRRPDVRRRRRPEGVPTIGRTTRRPVSWVECVKRGAYPGGERERDEQLLGELRGPTL